MLSPEKQLIQTAKLVEQWQQAKKYKTSPVPAKLREQITALFEHFSYTKLKNNLNISETLLYRWSQEYKGNGRQLLSQNKESAQETEFIELPPTCHEQEQGLSLALSVNNQCQMRLTGNFLTEQLDVITRNIFMYQAGANL